MEKQKEKKSPCGLESKYKKMCTPSVQSFPRIELIPSSSLSMHTSDCIQTTLSLMADKPSYSHASMHKRIVHCKLKVDFSMCNALIFFPQTYLYQKKKKIRSPRPEPLHGHGHGHTSLPCPPRTHPRQACKGPAEC